jgi:hypothetical protein
MHHSRSQRPDIVGKFDQAEREQAFNRQLPRSIRLLPNVRFQQLKSLFLGWCPDSVPRCRATMSECAGHREKMPLERSK